MRVARWTVVALLAGTMGRLEAQTSAPPGHELQLFLGAGIGRAKLTCDLCDPQSANSGMGLLSIDWFLNRGTILGGEVLYWANRIGNQDDLILSFMPHIKTYLGEAPVFMSIGAGPVLYRDHSRMGGTSASAIGGSFRIGVDVSLTHRVGVTPYVGLLHTLSDPKIRLNGLDTPVRAGVGHILQAGIGVSVR